MARRPKFSLRRTGIDEASLQKRREYVAVVASLEGSTVIGVSDGRRRASLEAFYEALGGEQLAAVDCVAIGIT